MALLTLDFQSEYMASNQSVNIIIPDKPFDKTCKEFYGSKKKYKVVWLLHGTFGSHSDWIRKSNIEQYACEKNLIVVMPGIGNADYENWPTFAMGVNSDKYITEELMPFVYNYLPASNKRKDNYVAGLSMGGKGALTFALKYPELFEKAAVLSFMPDPKEPKKTELKKLYNLSIDEVMKENDIFHSKQRLYNCMHNMGSVDNYLNSYYNMARKLKEADVTKLPKLLFTCGTDDLLFANEIDSFQVFAKKINLDAQFSFGPGNHEWKVWDRDIQIALDFFLSK